MKKFAIIFLLGTLSIPVFSQGVQTRMAKIDSLHSWLGGSIWFKDTSRFSIRIDTAYTWYPKLGDTTITGAPSITGITKGFQWNLPFPRMKSISWITGLQDSLSDRYRRGDTSSVLVSKDFATNQLQTKLTFPLDTSLTQAKVRKLIAGFGIALSPTSGIGDVTVTADTSASGGGITTLNGLNPVTQTFAIDSANANWGINSSISTHTFRFPGAIISGSIAARFKYTDTTAFRAQFLKNADSTSQRTYTNNQLALKLNIADTTSMLSPYLRTSLLALDTTVSPASWSGSTLRLPFQRMAFTDKANTFTFGQTIKNTGLSQYLWQFQNKDATTHLFVDSGGIIGTTHLSQTYRSASTGYFGMRVGGGGFLARDTTDEFYINGNINQSPSGNKYSSNGYSVVCALGAGSLTIYTAPSGLKDSAATLGRKFVMYNNGHVIIDTTTAAFVDNGAFLQINGNTTSNTLALGGATLDSAFTTSATQGVHIGRGLLVGGNASIGGTLSTTGAINSNTNLSASASPTFAGMTLNGNLAMGTNPISSVGAITSSGLLGVTVASGYAATFMDGNVGIGTTVPEGALHIKGMASAFPAISGTTQTGLEARLQSSNSNGVLDIGVNGGDGVWLQHTNRIDLSQNYPLLLNPNGGNVAIGTADPLGYKLYNNGTFYNNGNATVAGAITASGTGTFGGGLSTFNGTNASSATFGAGDSIQVSVTGVTVSSIIIVSYTGAKMALTDIPPSTGNIQTGKFTIYGTNGKSAMYWIAKI